MKGAVSSYKCGSAGSRAGFCLLLMFAEKIGASRQSAVCGYFGYCFLGKMEVSGFSKNACVLAKGSVEPMTVNDSKNDSKDDSGLSVSELPKAGDGQADGEVDPQSRRAGEHPVRKRKGRKAVLGVGVLLSLVVVWQGVGAAIAYTFLSSDYHNPPITETPLDRGLEFEELTIPVEVEPGKTINLSAWLLPADEAAENFQDGAVILMVHGFGGAKRKVWVRYDYRSSLVDQGAESFVRGGFHVVMLDFRNFGDSEDFGAITLGHRESEDVAAAVRYIADELPKKGLTLDPSRIGIRAPSMGAATTVLALARYPDLPVKAVWLDSMFATADDAISDFMAFKGVSGVFVIPTKFWMQTLSGARLSVYGWIQNIVRVSWSFFASIWQKHQARAKALVG